MIAIRNYDKSNLNNFYIDRNKSILVIGAGSTDYKLNQIDYYDSDKIVEQLYGKSQLSDAFSIAKEIGVPQIFLMNVKRTTDYIEIVDILKQYDFQYIVPLGIKFSDTFYNPDLNRKVFYGEFYLDSISDYTSSTILMTDAHASLYEDIDHFLTDMGRKIEVFNSVAYGALRNGRNFAMVANNLVSYEHANLIAASMLTATTYDKYPEGDIGQAIFDIDQFDLPVQELIYFKNNHLAKTSIENLKNFRIEQDAAKIITIDAVIKFIERELDFSDIKGKTFTEYVRLTVYNRLGEFLRSLIGTAIRSYSVYSVDFVKRKDGTGTLINNFRITPINSIEAFDLTMEV